MSFAFKCQLCFNEPKNVAGESWAPAACLIRFVAIFQARLARYGRHLKNWCARKKVGCGGPSEIPKLATDQRQLGPGPCLLSWQASNKSSTLDFKCSRCWCHAETRFSKHSQVLHNISTLASTFGFFNFSKLFVSYGASSWGSLDVSQLSTLAPTLYFAACLPTAIIFKV